MADFNALEALINAHIKKNGVQAITGNILNGILRGMVSALGKGYTIAGVAVPSSDPGTMTGPLAYLAYTAGTYTHFGGLEVGQGEVSMLIYNEAEWHKEVLFVLSATATVDDNVGTPEVGVSFVDGLLTFDFRNMKGNPGNDGDAAGFGTINATVDGNVGTPGVSVQSSGPDTAKNITFQFTNLKGETGVTSVVATVDNTVGTPTCTVSLVGQQLTLAFSGLKGAQGDTGSSVDYPFTIVNNLTTNDPTQALSAAMGVQLESEVSQLEAEVNERLGGEFLADLQVEQGTVNTNTGALLSSSTTLRTSNLIEGTVLRINTSGNKVNLLGYRADGTFIAQSSSGWKTESQYVSLPGAKKYRALFQKSDGTAITPSSFESLGVSVYNVYEGEFTTKDDFGKLQNELFGVNLGDWSVGSIGTADEGEYVIPDVFSNFYLRTKNLVATATGTLIIKNPSANLKVRLNVADGKRMDTSYYTGDIQFNITKGDVFRIAVTTLNSGTSFANYTSAQIQQYIKDSGITAIIDGAIEDVEVLKDELAVLKNGVSNLNGRTEKIESDYTETPLSSYVDTANVGYITWSGNMVEPVSFYRYTQPIPVSRGDKVTVKCRAGNTVAVIATCDANGDSKYRQVRGENTDNATTYVWYANNDGYIIVSFIAGSMENFNQTRFSPVYVSTRGAEISVEPNSNLLAVGDNPLGMVKETPGYAGAFRTWGFVGDSLASGVIVGYKNGASWIQANYDISWGEYMLRAMSASGKEYAVGGMTAKNWVLNNPSADKDRLLYGVQQDGGKQAYIVALGLNDAFSISSLYNNKVATDMENISADIDLADPTNNADTFAGWYARIIQEIKAVSPDSIIFPVVMPENNNGDVGVAINSVIREMPTIFAETYPNTIWAIDLFTYKPSSDYLFAFKTNGAHLNAQGYQYVAWMFMTYIDWLIRKNMVAFKGICFIGTGAHINND